LDSATPEDRRQVLEALDTRITVTETGGLDISIGVPGRVDCVHQTQSGETRHSLDINVTDVQFLGQRDGGGGEAVEAAEAAGHHVPDEDPDLPF